MALEQDQINSLVDGIVSRYRDADFQTTLEQAMDAAGADKGDRYLIRLEIGRRTAPCIRSMDFRDDRAAELREVHGVKHFLAPEDEKVLERRNLIDRLAKEYKADGIIYEQMKYCDYWGFERALVSHVMAEEYGWPVLSVDRLYNNGNSGQLRTRVQAFVESLEIKRIRREREENK